MVGARALFLTCTKKKMAFFEGWSWPGKRGGINQGPWLQERVGGGVGAGWPKRGKLAWQFCRKVGGECKGFGSGRVGVLFFESWRVDLVTRSFGSGGGRW